MPSEPLGPHVQGRRRQHTHGVYGWRTLVQEPGDQAALPTLDTFQLKLRDAPQRSLHESPVTSHM
jgi:hypothetical protein